MFEDSPFKSVPRNLTGDPFSKKTTIKKTATKKTAAKKPPVGKKPKIDPKAGKKLPEKKITCPYCGTVNTFPKYRISRFCSECGKVYFR